jgi:transcriptional regulator with XRE-family HTH domain
MNRQLSIVRASKAAEMPATLLGARLAEIRGRLGLTLKDVSARTGIPISTLSKVQNHQASLNYENLVKLSVGLGLDVSEFFNTHAQDLRATRRTVDRAGRGRRGKTERYDYELLASELANKRLVPGILTISATDLDEVGGLSRHAGEEFIHVLSGTLVLHTEHYQPVVLKAGDSAYIDSSMGHAYLAQANSPGRKKSEVRLLAVCTHSRY